VSTARRARAPATRTTRPVFRGWWLVLGAAVILPMQGGLMWQAYGLYVPVWQVQEGWSAVALAGAFSLYQAASGLLGPVQSALLRALGPVRTIRIGLVAGGGGMALLSAATTLPFFFAAVTVIGLGFTLSGGMSLSTMLVNWFERRRARAFSLMMAGKVVGGLIVMVVAWSLVSHGWRTTALASGLVFTLVGLAASASFEDTPERRGLRPDGEPAPTGGGDGEAGVSPGARATERGMSASAALHTRAFWHIALSHLFTAMVVTSLVAHLGTHLRSVGFSLPWAAAMVAAVTGAATVGLLIAGAVGDRSSKRHVSALATLGHAVALTILALSRAPEAVYAFVVIHGLSWGLRESLVPTMRADYFGRSAFVVLEGVSRTFMGIGMVAGPVLTALVREWHGDYTVSFLALAGASLAASALLVTATPPATRDASTAA
jgi:sugar phosphate permease